MARAVGQFDMFAVPPGAPREARPVLNVAPPAPPIPIPARPPAWEAKLAASLVASDLRVLVITAWTGVCLEVLSCPNQGRLWLDRDGAIGEFPRDRVHGRVVYATPAMARAWHSRRELRLVCPPGTGCAEFVFGVAPGAAPLIFPAPFKELSHAA